MQSVLTDEIKGPYTDTEPLMPADAELPALAAPFVSGYAYPILILWQKTPVEWIAKVYAKVDVKDQAAKRKQRHLKAQTQAWQSIKAII